VTCDDAGMDDVQTEAQVAAHNVEALLMSVTTYLGNAQHSLDRAEGDLEDLRTALAYYIAQVSA